MKSIKYALLAFVAALASNTQAQENKWICNNVAIGQGEKATVIISLENESDGITAAGFIFKLPEGVHVVGLDPNAKTSGTQKVNFTLNEDRVDNPVLQAISYSFKKKQYTASFLNENVIIGHEGWIFAFDIEADENAPTSNATIEITDNYLTVNRADVEGTPASFEAIVAEGFPVKVYNGWATAASTTKALDLSDVSAYVVTNATADATTVEKVTSAAPGVGILINSEEDVVIPFATSGDTPEVNLLTGVTASGTLDDNTNIYFLNNGSFKKAKAGSQLSIGRAYLTNTAAAAKDVLGIVVEDNQATGIENVETAQNNADVYNLNGVRVSKLQKGVYIQNGRKFIVK